MRVCLDHSAAHDILLQRFVGDIDLCFQAERLVIKHVLVHARHLETVAPAKEIARGRVAAGLCLRLVRLLLLGGVGR